MSDVLVQPALSAAPQSTTAVAFRISWSTFSTSTLKPTPIGSRHAVTTNTVQEPESWLDENHSKIAGAIARRNETLLRGIRLGIGFGAAAFAILLIGAVYVGIRCCRKKPSDEGDSSSMEISGVQYEMREEYGPKPKPLSRCSTCDTDAVRADGTLRADSGPSWSERPTSQDIIEEDWRGNAAREDRALTRVVHPV